MKEARVVVVGAGKMGALHARVFSAVSGARLAGVFDTRRDVADRVAAARGALSLRSLDEAIERADLVVVATPTPLHFEQAERALSAGCAVLVEKPLAASAAEARALCDLACARGARLLVGHSERFNPVVRALAKMTRAAEVRRLVTRRTSPSPGEELCVNLAVHDIDLVALLARAPVELVDATGGAEEAELVLRAGDASARARVGRGVRARTARVETSQGVFVGDLVAGTLVVNGAPVALDDDEPLAGQAAAAVAACAGERSAIASGLDGLRAVTVAELAAARLSTTGRVSAAE